MFRAIQRICKLMFYSCCNELFQNPSRTVGLAIALTPLSSLPFLDSIIARWDPHLSYAGPISSIAWAMRWSINCETLPVRRAVVLSGSQNSSWKIIQAVPFDQTVRFVLHQYASKLLIARVHVARHTVVLSQQPKYLYDIYFPFTVYNALSSSAISVVQLFASFCASFFSLALKYGHNREQVVGKRFKARETISNRTRSSDSTGQEPFASYVQLSPIRQLESFM